MDGESVSGREGGVAGDPHNYSGGGLGWGEELEETPVYHPAETHQAQVGVGTGLPYVVPQVRGLHFTERALGSSQPTGVALEIKGL